MPGRPHRGKLWISDLRTNKHFTLKTNPLARAVLDEFVALYHPANRLQRQATWSAENPDGRWRLYELDELVAATRSAWTSSGCAMTARPTATTLPPPDVIAQEIVDDLEAALEQFRLIAADLAGEATE